MSKVTLADDATVSKSDFWVNTGAISTDEQFTDQTGQTGGALLGIGQVVTTYSTYQFTVGEFTYSYVGAWTLTVDGALLTATTGASGWYDQVVIEKNGTFYASLELDEKLNVDFGSQTGLSLLGLGLDDLLNPLLSLVLSNGGEGSVDNLHLAASPELVDLLDGLIADTPTDGDDDILGTPGDDNIDGGLGDDIMHGGQGNDTLHGGAGKDTIYGDAGNDKLFGDAGNDRIHGGPGNDAIHGGTGNDRIWGDAGRDKLWGDDDDDILRGSAGNDRLKGGNGDDVLIGGRGRDVLVGGGGADAFVFLSRKDSTGSATGRDTIRDFTHNDTIDLHRVDADSGKAGNQAFEFIGKQGFHGDAGELRFTRSGSDTLIQGDTDGDGKADFSIRIDDVIGLRGNDFIL